MITWKSSPLIAIFAVGVFTHLALSEKRTIQRSSDVKDWVRNVINDQADAITKAKRNLVSGVKSWVIVEPTERETNYVDEALCSMFSLGTDNLIDTMERMENLCQDKSTYLVEIAAWVIRKYTFHLNIRVFMNIVLNNMRKKIDLYCADTKFKENYINFMKNLTSINPKLNQIRFNFVDTLVSIQRSKIGATKIPNFCCGYWRYKNHTLEAIDRNIPELRTFIADMMDSFYSDAMALVCLPIQMTRHSICSYYPGDHAEGQIRQSILMNMVDAISKITYIIL